MFVHLHVHSEYSLLDGMPTAAELAQAAADLGQEAIAITDHGNLHGAIDFYKACKDKGIKPIIGCEVYTTIDRQDKDESSLKERGASDWHLVLIAKNDVGYANLIKIVTDAHLEGFHRRPRTDDKTLAAYAEGIVALSSCIKGRIPDLLLHGEREEAARIALEYKEMFDDFYLELQANALPEQAVVNAELIRLGGMLDIPLVVTCDSHYIFANDASVHEVLLAIGTNKKMDDDDRLSFGAEDFYLKSPEEILAMVPIQEALENTVKIAAMVELDLDKSDLYLPHVEVPFGYDEEQYLAKLCSDALYSKLAEYPDSDPQEYWDRLEHELAVIEQKGIAGYFLVVWDLVAWSVNSNIAMGPGRGSVGGSLVSYLLGITKIDPIEHGLLFERFINPDRVSLPDIDLDFCYDNRHRILEYVTNKYGSDKVANVATFGTLTSRSVLDGVASAMGVPFADRKIITKSVPAEPGITLDEALEKSQRLREHEQAHPEIFRIAKRLEGRKRHRSTHACGLILANVPLTDFTALRRSKGSQGEIVTHLDMDTLGEIGAVKFDVLGLKTVTVVDRTARTVNIDIDKIPLDCEETYKLFRTGQLNGVFQLEGSWASQNVKEIGPTEFRHLVDAVSLIRPGPMESGATDDYMTYRHGRKEISYLHPDLEAILRETYGVLVYQEQVMSIAGVFAGYTPAQQDSFRAAIGKKKKEDLDEELAIFRQRSIERGYSEYIVDSLCQAISKHARYSFNKCIAGSERIMRPGSKGHWHPTIEEMYRIRHDSKYAKLTGHIPLHKKYKLFGYGQGFSMQDNDRIKPNSIVDIRPAGKRLVYRVTTETGASLLCTDNHKFPTPNGETMLKDLSVGDVLYSCGDYEPCTNTYNFTDGNFSNNYPAPGEQGFRATGGPSVFYKTVKAFKRTSCTPCEKCSTAYSPDERFELHHADGDRTNNKLSNLVWVCNSCHKTAHYLLGRQTRHGKGYPASLDIITSIIPRGEEETYDIEMAAPHHNFVMESGIVVSNSHATGYAMLAYQTAYLKVHHQLEFMAAILTSDQSSGDKVTQYIAECKKLGLRVLPPDINRSSGEFTVDDGAIRFSLGAIKNVGHNASREITSGQPYENMEDFVRRVARRTVNKKVMEALIHSGAFDCFNPNRREVLRDYYRLRVAEGTVKNKDGTVIDPDAVDTTFSEKDRMNAEVESLGVYISAHPCDNERNDNWIEAYEGETLTITGIVVSMREVLTKREEEMGIATIDLPNGHVDVVVFPRQYKKFSKRLKLGQSVIITGQRNDRGIIAENVDKTEKRSESVNGQSERGVNPERTVPS